MTEAVDDPTEHDSIAGPGDGSATTSASHSGDLPADRPAPDGDGHGAIDIIGIEADLDGVQSALTRLADGTYWTDEITGEPLPADLLEADPMARRA